MEEKKGFIESLANGLKILTSKRAYALGGTIVGIALIKNPFAIGAIALVAITYIVCESKRPT